MSVLGSILFANAQGGSGGAGASGSGAPTVSGLDTQTVTTGAGATGIPQHGFVTGSFGSISDGTSNLYAGAAITKLYWDQNTSDPKKGTGTDFVQLGITGASLANSGWTQVAIDTFTLSRGSATYTTSGGITYWTWYAPGGDPFGTTGTAHDCVFS